ncbi:MAG: 4'-phosphopantetheinyl transferase superfamily protein [Paludibacteraceae bacterium]|nr:4'-phosphopantetheinyl transferase superfamily protein [Paludibacteraceae bacterium]
MLYLEDQLERFTDREVEMWMHQLPVQRRHQAESIRHALGRRQCVLSYRLLCRALQEEYGIAQPPEFEYGEHGKPMLAAHRDIHFSLSHCRQAVACVVSDRPVGVDVETIGRGKPDLMDYVLSDNERRAVEASDRPQELFAELWTRKEALCKLTGEGITDQIATLLENDWVAGICFQTKVCREKGYVCTVACEKAEL